MRILQERIGVEMTDMRSRCAQRSLQDRIAKDNYVSSKPLSTTRALVNAYAVALFLACGLSACKSGAQDEGRSLDYVSSPLGAIAPKGVSEILKGMSQQEVLRTLSPMYLVIHAAAAYPSNPIADFFLYKDGQSEKYIEVFYEGEQVFRVRFGYEEILVIELQA